MAALDQKHPHDSLSNPPVPIIECRGWLTDMLAFFDPLRSKLITYLAGQHADHRVEHKAPRSKPNVLTHSPLYRQDFG